MSFSSTTNFLTNIIRHHGKYYERAIQLFNTGVIVILVTMLTALLPVQLDTKQEDITELLIQKLHLFTFLLLISLSLPCFRIVVLDADIKSKMRHVCSWAFVMVMMLELLLISVWSFGFIYLFGYKWIVREIGLFDTLADTLGHIF